MKMQIHKTWQQSPSTEIDPFRLRRDGKATRFAYLGDAIVANQDLGVCQGGISGSVNQPIGVD